MLTLTREQVFCQRFIILADYGGLHRGKVKTRKRPSSLGQDDPLPVLRSLLLYTERVLYLTEALYDILLILRFYIFQGDVFASPTSNQKRVRVDLRFAKLWIIHEPSIHGQNYGTVLEDVVSTILIVMRACPQNHAIQTLCIETIDKMCSAYSNVDTLFASDSNGHRCIARDVGAGCRRITKAEAATIMDNAALHIRAKCVQWTDGHDKMMERKSMGGPLVDPDCYPCNEISTRHFFGDWRAFLGKMIPVMWARWAKWNNPEHMYKVVGAKPTLDIGDIVELLDLNIPCGYAYTGEDDILVRVVSTGKVIRSEYTDFQKVEGDLRLNVIQNI